MSEHLQPAELRQYRKRRLTPAALRRVDLHLAACAACRASLIQKPDLLSARCMLRAVERATPHLPYEQLEAWVDGTLAAAERITVDAHLAACPRCARELAEMRSYARVLSQRPALLPTPRPPLLERLQAWLGGAMALRAVTAGLVVAVAATVVLSSGVSPFGAHDRGAGGASDAASDAIRASAPSDVAGASPTKLPVERDAFDRSVFDRLDDFAPEAVSAYRAGEYATVASNDTGCTIAICGRVVAVRQIEQKAEGTGVGAAAGGVLGGLAGHQVGRGRGNTLATIAGAVAGAFGGNEVEKHVRRTTSYEVTVRLDNGTTQVITQSTPWQNGARVRVVNGVISAANS